MKLKMFNVICVICGILQIVGFVVTVTQVPEKVQGLLAPFVPFLIGISGLAAIINSCLPTAKRINKVFRSTVIATGFCLIIVAFTV